MRQRRPGVTTRRLEPRLAAVLCYLLGIIGGVILLKLERDSRFVRFHALQSILYCATATAVLAIEVLARYYAVAGPTGLAFLAVWLFLMYRAARGEWYQLPWLGTWAERGA
jgi:uncharacterized membrane protein